MLYAKTVLACFFLFHRLIDLSEKVESTGSKVYFYIYLIMSYRHTFPVTLVTGSKVAS